MDHPALWQHAKTASTVTHGAIPIGYAVCLDLLPLLHYSQHQILFTFRLSSMQPHLDFRNQWGWWPALFLRMLVTCSLHNHQWRTRSGRTWHEVKGALIVLQVISDYNPSWWPIIKLISWLQLFLWFVEIRCSPASIYFWLPFVSSTVLKYDWGEQGGTYGGDYQCQYGILQPCHSDMR
jgi:hypothetical protein